MSSQTSRISIFTTDANLIVRSWDSRLAQMTGLSAEATCGRPLTAVIPDLESRDLLSRFQRVLREGVIETLAPAFHQYLIACEPQQPSKYFDRMQQRVTIAPQRENDGIVGTIVIIEDVTARRERECEVTGQLTPGNRTPGTPSITNPSQTESERVWSQPTVTALQNDNWQVRWTAIDDLAIHSSAETTLELLRVLREEHRNISVLNSVLQVLSISNIDPVPGLISCLNEPDVDLRIYAALALGERQDPRAIPALLLALDDPDTNVRFHAIESLGYLRATQAADALAAIAESGDFFLAFPAVDALIRIDDPTIAMHLIPLLKQELLSDRVVAAIAQLGDAEAIEPIVTLLNDWEASAPQIATCLVGLHDRYEKTYGEGAYITDLVRNYLTPSGQERLLQALEKANANERRALAITISWLQGPDAERVLAGLLATPEARDIAVEALVHCGTRIGELLIAHLEGEDVNTRKAAALALGRIGDNRAVPALTASLTADPELVAVAATALAQIGDRRAFESLLTLLGNSNTAVRQAAIAALNSLGHPHLRDRVVTLLSDPNPYTRESAVRIAGYFAFSKCTDLLFECSRDPEERVRRAVMENLPYLEDSRAIETLTAALTTETDKVRAAAARALGEIDPMIALPHLLQALRDEDQWVRYQAVRALGKLAQGQVQNSDPDDRSSEFLATLPQEPLIELAQFDVANPVRAAAVATLGCLGSTQAIPLLTTLAEMEDGDGDVARTALVALGTIGHPDALPPLLQALRSPNPKRRIDAIRALGERGSAGTADALQWVAAADPDAEVVQAAIDALYRVATQVTSGQSESRSAISALLELTVAPDHREACIAVLVQLGEVGLEEISLGLQHPHPSVRCSTVSTLARLKRPDASQRLMTALDDRDGTVRLAACTALAHLGNCSCEEKLTRLAHADTEPAVRRAAQKALRR